jgi:hypothetical protein
LDVQYAHCPKCFEEVLVVLRMHQKSVFAHGYDHDATNFGPLTPKGGMLSARGSPLTPKGGMLSARVFLDLIFDILRFYIAE